MLRIMKNKWLWIIFFSLAVVVYLILDIVDVAQLPRQILIFPMCFLQWIICSAIDCNGGLLGLDTDMTGMWETFVRTLSFAIELGAVFLPGYFYAKTNKNVYLFVTGLAIVWIITGLCFFFLAFLSMRGMMD